MTRDDPELGTEKLCNICGEWWPLDEEFWYFTTKHAGSPVRWRDRTYARKTTVRVPQSRCRACWAERSAAGYAARQSA